METKTTFCPQDHHGSRIEDVAEEPINPTREDEYLEIVRKLRLDLANKSDECEALKIKLNESGHEVETLNHELNLCKLTIFENDEDSKKAHEEVMRSRKLEEDNIRLMGNFLDLKEQNDRCRQSILDNYLSKANAINNIECLISSGALNHKLNECKLELENKLADMQLLAAKVRNLEEETSSKDKSINDLKKALDDAKVTHQHEISVLEDYIQCLKNTITSYEKTLASYMGQKSQQELTSVKTNEED